MAGSTFQPPINLDPNQDSSQQTAFINQNFQSLATTLEKNSIRLQGAPTILTSTVPTRNISAVGVYNDESPQITVAHNLGFTPVFIAFEGNSAPYGNIATLFGGGISGNNPSRGWYTDNLVAEADDTNIYFFVNRTAYLITAGAATLPASTYSTTVFLAQIII